VAAGVFCEAKLNLLDQLTGYVLAVRLPIPTDRNNPVLQFFQADSSVDKPRQPLTNLSGPIHDFSLQDCSTHGP
jgi:hypothetical protein